MKGREDPVETMYRMHYPKVYGYLLRLTRDPELAQELAHDTFVQAIPALERFRGESSLSTWLCGIGRNLWMDHLRKQRPTLEYDDLLACYIGEGPEQRSCHRATLERVMQLLEQKGDPARQVVKLRAQGYSYREIARMAGISEGSARVVDFRCRQWMRQVLQEEGYW